MKIYRNVEWLFLIRNVIFCAMQQQFLRRKTIFHIVKFGCVWSAENCQMCRGGFRAVKNPLFESMLG